jgi:hypothetical protein
MKKILFILLAVIPLKVYSQPLSKVNTASTCYLKNISIHGESNVNEFNFTYSNNNKSHTNDKGEVCHPESDTGDVIFYIPVNQFEPSNIAMLHDFKTLIKASDYPEVMVEVDKKTLLEIISGISFTHLNFKLTLAGVTRPIDAQYSAYRLSGSNLVLSGKTQIKLTDFSLEPPEKMFGIIRVENKVFINFEIILPVNNSSVITKT